MSDDPKNTPEVINTEFSRPDSEKEIQESQVAEELSSSKAGQLTMRVKVASPFTSYYAGDAFSISGVNATGPFDILPKHHNFMSLLQPSTLIIRTSKGDEKKIAIGGGLLHVKSDKVTVFLDI